MSPEQKRPFFCRAGRGPQIALSEDAIGWRQFPQVASRFGRLPEQLHYKKLLKHVTSSHGADVDFDDDLGAPLYLTEKGAFNSTWKGKTIGFDCYDSGFKKLTKWAVSEIKENGCAIFKGGGAGTPEIVAAPAKDKPDSLRSLKKGDRVKIKAVISGMQGSTYFVLGWTPVQLLLEDTEVLDAVEADARQRTIEDGQGNDRERSADLTAAAPGQWQRQDGNHHKHKKQERQKAAKQAGEERKQSQENQQTHDKHVKKEKHK